MTFQLTVALTASTLPHESRVHVQRQFRDGVVPRREAHDRRNNVQVFRELCPRLVKEYDVGTLSELVERRRPTPPSPSLVEWDK